ncbi:DUF4097 family beta strand repeat-containing protein [Hazenella coriacea]|uniref:Putative adhesin n=1 Tax=Hazenella coriacea TaxID=1179467 RepID=A0A4R3L2L4_9BACL|nr:DUF4097 family beta strand repeat-containing protein [Hazenella coriacea]TCS93088.1 putative adhesin [Hazenella coriacea]
MKSIIKISLIMIIVGLIGISSLLYILGWDGIGGVVGKDVIEQKQIDGKEINQVKINSKLSNINIYPSPNDQIELKLEGTVNQKADIDFQVSAENHQLSITVDYINKFPMSFKLSHLNLDVYLPEKVYDSVNIKSDIGEISIDQKLLAKKLELKSDIGEIEVDEFEGDELICTSNLGDMKLKKINASFDIKTETGSVDMNSVSSLKNNNKIKTQLGNVNVELSGEPKSLGLDLSTELGEIETDFMVHTKTSGKNASPIGGSLQGLVGEKVENAPTLTVSTELGDISIEKK